MQRSEPYVKIGQELHKRVYALSQFKDKSGPRPENFEPLTEDEKDILRKYLDSLRKFNAMQKARGDRYKDRGLHNYVCSNKTQSTIVQSLREHAESIESLSTRNVVLFGPKGTGKDHLLNGLARDAFYHYGLTTVWRQGLELHEILKRRSFADYSVDLSCDGKTAEQAAPILWISDPIPPSGGLTEFQQSQFFSLIDSRYSDMLPTWVSMNVANGSEAELRMGAQVVDRLKHDALVFNCNWESYRKPMGVQS